ncbi:MAG: carboxylating nicotinate-nucleotide diphosphorylase [bacterium]|uniref:Probable nicotinate-nucleotide pyrophosphorylase [carboxylating] n=1 Tax=Candidatus Methylomirabilis tolerans TaxID=3123416 RepID=A0AAJ1AKD0_9BACT|nr:carboxylating nicotinate-nucleotide diphosphorylase [Candidatus Methylomirabilis sp.]
MSLSLVRTSRREALKRFLEEDIGQGDVTTLAIVPPDQKAIGHFMAKAPLVLAGIEPVIEALTILDEGLTAETWHRDGDTLREGDRAASIRGHARALLTGERVATNLLQRLCGIATLTRQFVEAVRGTQAKILDTRKTTPGLRVFEKYAVTVGGGINHRFGLDDAILIKDNHIRLAGGISAAITTARQHESRSHRFEVEVTTLEELQEALQYDLDAILLDNMNPDTVRQAVACVRAHERGNKIVVEASGGMTLDTVRAFAEAGVDWISIGALTHAAPAVDMSFKIYPA